jgi:alpha-mannosidase
LPRPDGGVAAALATRYRVRDARPPFVHDHPYGVSEITPRGRYPRKYPTGDWMTSPQWFEQVDRPFTAYSFLDLGRDGDRGVLVLHDGSQAFGLEDDGAVRQVLSLYDPWDEDYFVPELAVRLRLIPHAGLRNAERWRLAQEFERAAWAFVAEAPGGSDGGVAAVHPWVGLRDVAGGPPPGVVVTAVYREDERAGTLHEGYVGRGMGHPLVVRLVEFDGVRTEVELEVAGTVAAAYGSDLLGERGRPLDVEPCDGGSRVRLALDPYQIATVYVDVVEARKVARDLDARREVWAQVHRRDEARSEG